MLTEAECRNSVLPNTVCFPHLRRFSPYCRLVDVSQAAPQVYLVVGESYKNTNLLTFSDTRAYLELRRKGNEVLIATYHVWRRDENGAIGFFFDDMLFSQPPGYFVGDVFLNCCYCFSVQLRLLPCTAFALDCYAAPVLDTGGKAECTFAAGIGRKSIGGLLCTPVSSSEQSCGPIPPFFPIDNPQPPEPPAPSCVVITKGIGGGTIGL